VFICGFIESRVECAPFSASNLYELVNKIIRGIKMGMLWEIVQTGLMYGQKQKSDSVEDRVQYLEERLTATQNTLRSLVKKLEEMQGTDIDGDGRVG
jgi:hypothetical protein